MYILQSLNNSFEMSPQNIILPYSKVGYTVLKVPLDELNFRLLMVLPWLAKTVVLLMFLEVGGKQDFSV